MRKKVFLYLAKNSINRNLHSYVTKARDEVLRLRSFVLVKFEIAILVFFEYR